ncbi:ABC transporter ATP-binding protein [Actinobacteria bacterium YIM 96077]|uniref:ABC transporter ATP-binding protein n=1 Tax=Phytoactinopolyspora halophila TaxID=1981511 RepID=A0A329QHW2_9ACTN|nr:ABC transporter ATP-binding protein [Phytoactinopolyspora halophila]AYY14356.1 ABC transporter ATP-binding protein [Actinobacteria bacterium YIM 96077]RAW11920.1 ABC transporter ATP-binding protein [Phytoactinopolyspora halophila]
MTGREGERGQAVLRAVGLRKTFRDTLVFENFHLEVSGGGLVALVGPNGAGKSTLLECLAGAMPLDAGSITIVGEVSDPSSASHWRSVYGVLDDFTWLPDLTVADHMMLMSPERDADAVHRALESFGVAGIRDRMPESLSSGQRQRAALATVHVRPWHVLLLDEPENHLDSEGFETLVRELEQAAEPRRCIVLSSHSSVLVERLGCPVITMAAPG